MSKVLCIGDSAIDVYLPPKSQKFIGGNALNTAVHLKDAGCDVSFMGALGNDKEGKWILDSLAKKGIDISHSQIIQESTPIVKVQLDENGERHFLHDGPRLIPHLCIDQKDLQYIWQHKLVHNTWLGGTEAYLSSFHGCESTLVTMDYGEHPKNEFVEKTIRFVDIAFFSAAPGRRIEAEAQARQIHGLGPRLVVITMGNEGSIAFDGKIYYQNAFPTKIVDSLGAGDAFIATFLAHWLKEESIPRCLEQATWSASRCCGFYGAWEGSQIF